MEVAGLSGSRSGFNTGPFLERMDRLTAAVEAMTGQMAWIADSTRSVSRSNDRLSASLETFFEECRFVTSEFIVSEEESEEECYDHVQLRALSGYSGRIAALQLNSGRASLTLVTVAQIYLH